MDVIEGLAQGFSVALEWENLLFVTLGVLLGTVIGLLPGLGPTAAIAVLLPITFSMDATSAIIMMPESITAVCMVAVFRRFCSTYPATLPRWSRPSTGIRWPRRGKAGPALGITAIASFLGGTVSIIGLSIFAPIVASWDSRVGPPETVILSIAGLLLASMVSAGLRIKALMMAALGLLIAAIGIDMVTGERRLTFGSLELSSGIDIIPLAVGLLGLREILFLAEKKIKGSGALGKIDGIQLGGGGSLSSIADYGLQKEFSKNPEMFGKGAIDGLAATETADNASSNSAFIPLLTLGLPPNSVLTLLFGVLMLHNVTPGPTMIEDHPNVFWGVIASMYIGNALLLLFNLPAFGAFVQILRISAGL